MAEARTQVSTTYLCSTCQRIHDNENLCAGQMLVRIERTHLWREVWLDTLARNIAMGAFGCMAFGLGNANGWDEAAVSEGYLTTDSWRPGCQQPAPGWEGK